MIFQFKNYIYTYIIENQIGIITEICPYHKDIFKMNKEVRKCQNLISNMLYKNQIEGIRSSEGRTQSQNQNINRHISPKGILKGSMETDISLIVLCQRIGENKSDCVG